MDEEDVRIIIISAIEDFLRNDDDFELSHHEFEDDILMLSFRDKKTNQFVGADVKIIT